jgi:hypothetical protein
MTVLSINQFLFIYRHLRTIADPRKASQTQHIFRGIRVSTLLILTICGLDNAIECLYNIKNILNDHQALFFGANSVKSLL